MRMFGIGAVLVVTAFALSRTSLGLRLGNELRSISDRVMLGFLRVTSEFEREDGAS